MKAFSLSVAALLVIALSAAFVLNEPVGQSAEEAFTSNNVRLD